MASTTTCDFKIALRDIAIVSIYFAFQVALGTCTRRQVTSDALSRTRATTPPRQFRRFASLPVEIREIIYEHAMRSGGHFAAPSSAASRAARTSYVLHNQIPAACFTNSVERLVAASVFIRNFDFVLSRESDAARISAWLEQFGDRYGFCSVKNMQLNYVSSNQQQSLINRIHFVRHCPGLRDLTVSIPLNEISVFTHVSSMRLRLDGLLQCGQLRKVRYIISGSHGFHYVATSVRAATLRSIAQAVAAGFGASHGRLLHVNIDVSDRNGRILGRIM